MAHLASAHAACRVPHAACRMPHAACRPSETVGVTLGFECADRWTDVRGDAETTITTSRGGTS